MLGACGALVGTRFYATEEALGHSRAKELLVHGSGDETLRTRVFDVVRRIDWPQPFTGRALRNELTRAWHGREGELADDPREGPRYAEAVRAGQFDTAVEWAGEGVDLIGSIEPARRVVERMVAEAEAALARVSPGAASGYSRTR